MTTAPRARRYDRRPFSLVDLERAIGSASTTDTARWIHAQYRQVLRLRRRGLTVAQADHFALVAGLHPAQVWRDW